MTSWFGVGEKLQSIGGKLTEFTREVLTELPQEETYSVDNLETANQRLLETDGRIKDLTEENHRLKSENEELTDRAAAVELQLQLMHEKHRSANAEVLQLRQLLEVSVARSDVGLPESVEEQSRLSISSDQATTFVDHHFVAPRSPCESVDSVLEYENRMLKDQVKQQQLEISHWKAVVKSQTVDESVPSFFCPDDSKAANETEITKLRSRLSECIEQHQVELSALQQHYAEKTDLLRQEFQAQLLEASGNTTKKSAEVCAANCDEQQLTAVDRLNAEVCSLKNSLVELDAEHEVAIAQLLNAKQAALSDQTKANAELAVTKRELERTRSLLESRSASTDIAACAKSESDLGSSSKLHQLETQLEQVLNENRELNAAYLDLNAQLERRQLERDVHVANNQELHAKLDSLKRDLVEYEEKYEKCKQENLKAVGQLESLSSDFEMLKMDLSAARTSSVEFGHTFFEEEIARLKSELQMSTLSKDKLLRQLEDYEQANVGFHVSEADALPGRAQQAVLLEGDVIHIVDEVKTEVNKLSVAIKKYCSSANCSSAWSKLPREDHDQNEQRPNPLAALSDGTQLWVEEAEALRLRRTANTDENAEMAALKDEHATLIETVNFTESSLFEEKQRAAQLQSLLDSKTTQVDDLEVQLCALMQQYTQLRLQLAAADAKLSCASDLFVATVPPGATAVEDVAQRCLPHFSSKDELSSQLDLIGLCERYKGELGTESKFCGTLHEALDELLNRFVARYSSTFHSAPHENDAQKKPHSADVICSSGGNSSDGNDTSWGGSDWEIADGVEGCDPDKLVKVEFASEFGDAQGFQQTCVEHMPSDSDSSNLPLRATPGVSAQAASATDEQLAALRSAVSDDEKALQVRLAEARALANQRLEELEALRVELRDSRDSISSKNEVISRLEFGREDLLQNLEESRLRTESLLAEVALLRQQLDVVSNERQELAALVNKKHEEAVCYHQESQRLALGLQEAAERLRRCEAELTARHATDTSQTQTDVVDEEATFLSKAQPLQEQIASQSSELAAITLQFQNTVAQHEYEKAHLLAQNDAALDKLLRESQLKAQELENIQSQSVELSKQLALLNDNRNSLASELDVECKRSSELSGKLAAYEEKEEKLLKEIERLRSHLLQVEVNYTNEMQQAEDREVRLRAQVRDAAERLSTFSSEVQDKGSRHNEELADLTVQLQSLAKQRDEALLQLADEKEELQKNRRALTNLQHVLQQFQQDRDSRAFAEIEKLKADVEAVQSEKMQLQQKAFQLETELHRLHAENESAPRLKQQLSVQQLEIEQLRTLGIEKDRRNAELQAKLCDFKHADEDKIDKALLKNLFLGYLMAPTAKKPEVVHLLGAILGFTPTDFVKVKSGVGDSTVSFGDNKTKFLESESLPPPTPVPLLSPNSVSDTSSSLQQTTLSGESSNSPRHHNSPSPAQLDSAASSVKMSCKQLGPSKFDT